MTTFNIDNQTIIIQGQGTCPDCEAHFEGEPYLVHTQLQTHVAETGHDVYNVFADTLNDEVINSFVDYIVENNIR